MSETTKSARCFVLAAIGGLLIVGWVMLLNYCAVRVWAWNGFGRMSGTDVPFLLIGMAGVFGLGALTVHAVYREFQP